MRTRFEGSLTAHDAKRHIPHSFHLPAGSRQLDLHFRAEPQPAGGLEPLVTLTLFDPNGFRGAGHRDGTAHRVRLTAAEATPGYRPGPLPAGIWTAQLDTHRITPGQQVVYRLEIETRTGFSEAVRPQPATLLRPTPPQKGAGWYRGDLHSHSQHSDADRSSVASLVAAARDLGLDFLFLTDHNTISGLAEMAALTAPDLLTAGGLELTTFWGHALCLGTRQWLDWRVQPGNGDMPRLAASVYDRHQLFVIAHPLSVGDPECTGCAWQYGDMMPGAAQLVEIWNGPWDCDSNNEAALALWYRWLDQGHRLVATAGSDTHGADGYGPTTGFSVVYARALAEAEILAALRAGHLYLSCGPDLAFQARDTLGVIRMMGDTVAQPATVELAWSGCPAGACYRLMADGAAREEGPAGPTGQRSWRMAPGQVGWVVAEVRGRDGTLLAITNPIFFAGRHRLWEPAQPDLCLFPVPSCI